MRKRKMISLILIVCVIAIAGVSYFIMTSGNGKISMPDEQKDKSLQVSNAWSSDNQKKIGTINKRETSKKEANTPDSPPDNIPSNSSIGTEGSNFVSTSVSISGISDQPNNEEKRKLMEEQDKRCMELMHERGWYKPEDIPITYAEPQEPATPIGAYLWKVVKGVANPPKRPPEVKARDREFHDAMEAASAKGDGEKMMRIGQELDAVNRPYQPLSVRIQMHLERIPSAWVKYFFNLANTEQQKIFEEENRQQ